MSQRKTVLITGCSAGGIGHALAKEFHEKGLRVFATARRIDSMKELEVLGIETLALDVTDAAAARKIRDEIATQTGGKLDVLVNNAGQGKRRTIRPNLSNPENIAYPVAVTDMSMDAVRALFEVNLFAPMVMVQEFVHLLIAFGHACIINIGSQSGILPVPFSAAYNTSKAAIHALGNTLRVELAPFNVHVITDAVRSNIVKPHTIPDNSLYKSMEALYQAKRVNLSQTNPTPTEEYARTVVAEVLRPSPRAHLWAGRRSWTIWFMDRFLPRIALDWVMTRMFGFSEFAIQVRSTKDKQV
uniref:Putative NAD-P-binding protein n=1 Tax=Moniliophthora roreri TaxID=221103 RepID=A0A0W0GEF7_MONRR